MHRVTVNSDVFRSVGHDPEACLMEIEFHDGRIRLYNDVPISVYEDFVRASERGNMTEYFNNYIKDSYASAESTTGTS